MVGAIKGIDSKQGNKVAFALRLLLGATLASIISKKYYWLSFINNILVKSLH